MIRRTGLAKLPLSFWLLFSILVAYLTYNPWYSMGDILRLDIFWGLKVVIAGFYCGIMLLYFTEGSKSMSPMGLLVLVAIFGATIASLIHSSWITWDGAQYWAQIPAGLALFLALRWGAMYRAITGRVPVGTAQDDTHAHHS